MCSVTSHISMGLPLTLHNRYDVQQVSLNNDSRFFLFGIRLVKLVELGEYNKNQSSMTEGNFSVPPPYTWHCGTLITTPDWESVGCEFKSSNCFCLV